MFSLCALRITVAVRQRLSTSSLKAAHFLDIYTQGSGSALRRTDDVTNIRLDGKS